MRRGWSFAFGAVAALGLAAGAAAQTLSIGLGASPSALDPHFHNQTPTNAIGQHVFESLLGRDARMQAQPELATAVTTTDAITWDVTLRTDVTWHDGQPFTADDVLFTFERAPNVPNSPGSFGTYTRTIRSIVATGPHALRIVTSGPNPLLPAEIANIMIISRRHGEGASTQDYNSGKAMIGTGPYRFESYAAGNLLTYRRNDAYWGEREPWAQLRMRIITNPAARVATLLAGDVDVINDIPSTDVRRLTNDARFRVFTISSNRLVFLGFDRTEQGLETGFIKAHDGSALTRNPLSDPRVLRALSLAIDRRAIVERINQGEAVLANQYVPEGFFGWSPDIPAPAYDPEEARRLLAEAGWPQGFRLTLVTSNDRIMNAPQMVQAISQMWTRIGVQTVPELMPHSVFARRRDRIEFPALMNSGGIATGEALSMLVGQLGTRSRDNLFGAQNRIRYSNPALDALLREASVELDQGRRLALLQRGQMMALDDFAMPPILFQVNNWGARAGIRIEPRMDQATLAMSMRRE